MEDYDTSRKLKEETERLESSDNVAVEKRYQQKVEEDIENVITKEMTAEEIKVHGSSGTIRVYDQKVEEDIENVVTKEMTAEEIKVHESSGTIRVYDSITVDAEYDEEDAVSTEDEETQGYSDSWESGDEKDSEGMNYGNMAIYVVIAIIVIGALVVITIGCKKSPTNKPDVDRKKKIDLDVDRKEKIDLDVDRKEEIDFVDVNDKEKIKLTAKKEEKQVTKKKSNEIEPKKTKSKLEANITDLKADEKKLKDVKKVDEEKKNLTEQEKKVKKEKVKEEKVKKEKVKEVKEEKETLDKKENANKKEEGIQIKSGKGCYKCWFWTFFLFTLILATYQIYLMVSPFFLPGPAAKVTKLFSIIPISNHKHSHLKPAPTVPDKLDNPLQDILDYAVLVYTCFFGLTVIVYGCYLKKFGLRMEGLSNCQNRLVIIHIICIAWVGINMIVMDLITGILLHAGSYIYFFVVFGMFIISSLLRIYAGFDCCCN